MVRVGSKVVCLNQTDQGKHKTEKTKCNDLKFP